MGSEEYKKHLGPEEQTRQGHGRHSQKAGWAVCCWLAPCESSRERLRGLVGRGQLGSRRARGIVRLCLNTRIRK